MDKVIVIGCGVPGYAVIRAFANKGVHIIAMTYNKKDFAHLSRYVSEVVHIPRPEKDEHGFIAFLISNAHRWEGALILENSDNVATILSKNKALLSECYKVVTPDWESLNLFLEKDKTYALAKEAGVPFPRSTIVSKLEDLNKAKEIRYPAILKPVNSFEFQYRFVAKNFRVNDDKKLSEKVRLCVDAGQSMVLQEIIPGPDANLFKLQGYINSKGKMVGKFFHRKLRQHPPHFGVMRIGVSTEPFLEVEHFAEKLFAHANYRGYFSIEFKKDPRDGLLNLMENNCRMPRSGMLALASGINFPRIIYQDLVKNIQVDITEYKLDSYWIELYTDISDVLFRHHEEEISISDYIKPYLAKNKVFGDLDLHDLRPFLKLTRERADNIQHKLFPGTGKK